jgi:hypothetical protein
VRQFSGSKPWTFQAEILIRMSDEADTGGERHTLNIRSAQRLAWGNKVGKGFNTTDVPLEFCLLQGEMAEAFDAWRKGRADVAEELADVAIYLLSLAEMLGIDLQDAVEAKLAKNAARTYEPLPNGTLVKSAPLAEPDDPPEAQ